MMEVMGCGRGGGDCRTETGAVLKDGIKGRKAMTRSCFRCHKCAGLIGIVFRLY